jgi:hypothetical protein
MIPNRPSRALPPPIPPRAGRVAPPEARHAAGLLEALPTGLPTGLLAGLALVAVLLGALLLGAALAPGTVRAAREAPAAPLEPPPPEVLALLNAEPDRQWPALAVLRRDPAAARAGLLRALQREEPLPGRWRLIYRLVEFGSAEDVPLLLQIREQAQNPWERRIAEGAMRALYDPVPAGTQGLEAVVQDFAFIQTRSPARMDDPDHGKWRLSRWSLADYHRDDLPLAVIRNVSPIRGKAFDTRDQLADALQKRVGPRDWKALGERLLASAETVPTRVQLEGLARVRLQNPLQRPLLLSISLDAWFGQLREAPGSAWVYLEPGAASSVDLPVAPQGSLERPQIRLDLRTEEVDGTFLPGFHKLYLPVQP